MKDLCLLPSPGYSSKLLYWFISKFRIFRKKYEILTSSSTEPGMGSSPLWKGLSNRLAENRTI